MYLEIEWVREEKLQKENNFNEDLIELEHIHWKMIFDSINESINKFWPYGEQGVPMPWSQNSWKAISNEILNFDKIFTGIKSTIN